MLLSSALPDFIQNYAQETCIVALLVVIYNLRVPSFGIIDRALQRRTFVDDEERAALEHRVEVSIHEILSHTVLSAVEFAALFYPQWLVSGLQRNTPSAQWPWNPARYLDAIADPVEHRALSISYAVGLCYYLLTFYHYLTLEKPRRQNDYARMIMHHVITISLITLSWYYGYMRTGAVIMFCCDPSDVFLHVAKLLKLLDGNDAAATGSFVVMLALWLSMRVYWIVWRLTFVVLTDPAQLSPDLPVAHTRVFGALLTYLSVLFVAWTFEIFRVLARKLRGQALADVRDDAADTHAPKNGAHKPPKKKVRID